MNILMITQDFWPKSGGIQTYCYELAKALARQGVKVTVITCGFKDPRDDQDGFSVIRYPIFHTSFLFLWSPFIARQALKRIQGQFFYDAIIYGQWQSAFWTLLPFTRKKPHDVAMVHGRELILPYLKRLMPFFRNIIFKKINAIAPNSKAVLQLTKDVSSSQIPIAKVIHPGVNANLFSPPTATQNGDYLRERHGLKEKKIILTVTRLVDRKNPGTVIKALPIVLETIPEAFYVIIGNGPCKASLQELASSSTTKNQILFLGYVENQELIDWYKTCDLFVLPSRQTKTDVEGFGIVFLEAGACAKPVVGANTGGISDAVLEGETGILLQDVDDLKEMAAALTALLHPNGAGKEMGLKARKRIELELTWDKCAEQWRDFLKE